MSEITTNTTPDDADPRAEVLQAVVDRVTSWQDGATEETVRAELDKAVSESDVEISDDVRERIVGHLVDGEGDHVDIAELLG